MNEKSFKNISQTNWEALENMSDEEIDYSDIVPLTDDFFENAVLRIPASSAKNMIQLEPDIVAWFKSQEGEYKTTINSILRQYIEDCCKPSF